MRIYSEENKLYVESDYSAKFVREAKKLNGKWTGRAWRFDVRDEQLVRDVLINVYGTDGEKSVETVNVEVDVMAAPGDDSIELFGRVLCKRFSRDSQVRLHDSVIVSKGEFHSRGGSAKYPVLTFDEGTTLLVKDVPVSLVEKEMEKYPDAIKIVSDKKVDKDALLKEKESLLKRLAEIEELLK